MPKKPALPPDASKGGSAYHRAKGHKVLTLGVEKELYDRLCLMAGRRTGKGRSLSAYVIDAVRAAVERDERRSAEEKTELPLDSYCH